MVKQRHFKLNAASRFRQGTKIEQDGYDDYLHEEACNNSGPGGGLYYDLNNPGGWLVYYENGCHYCGNQMTCHPICCGCHILIRNGTKTNLHILHSLVIDYVNNVFQEESNDDDYYYYYDGNDDDDEEEEDDNGTNDDDENDNDKDYEECSNHHQQIGSNNNGITSQDTNDDDDYYDYYDEEEEEEDDNNTAAKVINTTGKEQVLEELQSSYESILREFDDAKNEEVNNQKNGCRRMDAYTKYERYLMDEIQLFRPDLLKYLHQNVPYPLSPISTINSDQLLPKLSSMKLCMFLPPPSTTTIHNNKSQDVTTTTTTTTNSSNHQIQMDMKEKEKTNDDKDDTNDDKDEEWVEVTTTTTTTTTTTNS